MLQVYTRGRRRNEDGSDLSDNVFFSKGTNPLHHRQVPPFRTWISRDYLSATVALGQPKITAE
jgi:hypothetical protein